MGPTSGGCARSFRNRRRAGPAQPRGGDRWTTRASIVTVASSDERETRPVTQPRPAKRPMTGPVAVVGGGIVGVCAAIELRARGLDVTLFDRGVPCAETSRWNAGVLATSSLVPLNNPGLFARLPALLTGRAPGLRVHPGALPATLPWALRFLGNARAARCEPTIAALRALITHSRIRHEALCKAAGTTLDSRGWLVAYRRHDGRAAAQQASLARRDVAAILLDRASLGALEPALADRFAAAVHVTESAFVDPATLGESYVALALRRGVAIRREAVAAIVPEADGIALNLGSEATEHFAGAVLAAGAWSKDLLAPLGLRLPLVVERGYLRRHTMRDAPSRPFFDVDGGYVVAPRPGGVQISTGTELTTLAANPRPAELDRATARARDILPLGAAHDETGIGNRPSLPDSLPAIGPVRRIPGLWLATGHQHVGLSTSAGTGHLLAAMMTGTAAPIDPRPYAPSRFGL